MILLKDVNNDGYLFYFDDALAEIYEASIAQLLVY